MRASLFGLVVFALVVFGALSGTAGAQSLSVLSTARSPVLGTQPNRAVQATASSVSADGRYVVFDTQADNLVAADTNFGEDVFLFDRQQNALRRFSVTAGGAQANGRSRHASISADGSVVVFQSTAANLVAGTPADGRYRLYAKRVDTGALQRLDETLIDGASACGPVLSGDGSAVVFFSTTVPDDYACSTPYHDGIVWLWDRAAGTVVRVNETADGTPMGPGSDLAIAGNASRVAYRSDGGPQFPTLQNSMVLWTRATRTTVPVLTDSGGTPLNFFYGPVLFSQDGNRIAFVTYHDGIVPGDTGERPDVFLRDLGTGATQLLSVGPDGSEGDGGYFSMSADGQRVVFLSSSPWPGAAGDGATAWLRDVAANTTTRIADVGAGNFIDTVTVVVAGNGSQVLLGATDGLLAAAGDSNRVRDLFIGPLTGAAWTRTSTSTTGTHLGGSNGWSQSPVLTPDGRFVAYQTDADNIVAGARGNLILHDRLTGSDVSPPRELGGSSDIDGVAAFPTTIDTAGTYVAYHAFNPGFIPFWPPPPPELDCLPPPPPAGGAFVTQVGETVAKRLDTTATGGVPDDVAISSKLSQDGRYVAFNTMASNIEATPLSPCAPQIYLRDRVSGTMTLVSRTLGGGTAWDYTFLGDISADGRFVAFQAWVSNLVPNDTNGLIDVFVFDRVTATTERINVTDTGAQTRGDFGVGAASLSADGRYVAFDSAADDLVPGDTNGSTDVFVRDRQLGTTTLASRDVSGQQFFFGASGARLDGSGRYVVFTGRSSLAGFDQVYWRDLVTGTTRLASVDRHGHHANADAGGAAVSDGGHVVVFSSQGQFDHVDAGTQSVSSNVYLKVMSDLEVIFADSYE